MRKSLFPPYTLLRHPRGQEVVNQALKAGLLLPSSFQDWWWAAFLRTGALFPS
jgi:hypothetical protein